jgi:hypothetical protein
MTYDTAKPPVQIARGVPHVANACLRLAGARAHTRARSDTKPLAVAITLGLVVGGDQIEAASRAATSIRGL